MNKVIDSTMMIRCDIEVTVEGMVEYEIDRNYGADRDGNRGECRVFVTGVTDITAFDPYLNTGCSLSKDEELQASDVLKDKFIENYGL